MTRDGESLCLGCTLRHPPQVGRLADQTEAVRSDDGEGAHPITELRRDMAAEHAAERKSSDVHTGMLREYDFEPPDHYSGQALRSMRLRRGRRLAETGQIGSRNSKRPRQRKHVADPMCPRTIAAVQQHEGRTAPPDVPD